MPKVDLHLLSEFSRRPPEWILRQLGIPESYTPVEQVESVLRSKGFDFITLTDVDTIEGCLKIADRPGVFISEKITASFPEDYCKVHLLAWNISEAQHREIQKTKQDIYELALYLRSENIVHGVATPLRSINLKLTADHVEKLLLLFELFEGRNACDAPLAQEVWVECVRQLEPATLERLADRHALPQALPADTPRRLFAGSGDYSGLYLGDAFTECAQGHSAADFLEQVRAGEGSLEGRSGDVTRFSSALYHMLIKYAARRMSTTAPYGFGLLKQVAERFLAGKNPAEISLGERIGIVTEAVRTGKAIDFIRPNDHSLNREVARYFLDPRIKKELDIIIQEETSPERRTFAMSSRIANDLLYRLFQSALDDIERGELIDSLQPATGMLPILAAVSPYLLSFHVLNGNRPMVQEVAGRLLPRLPAGLTNTRRAWFTDTLDDVNGVARTIRTMARAATLAECDLTVVVSRSEIGDKEGDTGFQLKNFSPVGEFELPEYELQKLSFPPVLDMIDYIERERFTECIISTPGPVGLTALAAAKLLGLRTSGIYHTDFPQYVRILTDDGFMETMMWQYMQWFYAQMDRVYVNSEYYRDCWVERGIPPERLFLLSRGLDTECFHYRRRDPSFWKERGATHPVLLYVGRVSKEKELEFLARVYQALRAEGVPLDLAIVGEGPYQKEMEATVPDAIFTGVLHGAELGTAYASADLFVFPSTTDTFGNVVVEAIASGVPAMVSDVGGPKEIIHPGEDGWVLPANDLDAWVGAIRQWAAQPPAESERIAKAERVHRERSWHRAFKDFWEGRDAKV
jgi:glycosyltransferase involved in cell wall biosynthesis